MRSKSRTADDTTFDRRRPSAAASDATASHAPLRRRGDSRSASKVSAPTVEDAGVVERTSKRRSTRDGREPLVVYMRPESIKALKIAALEHDTTASAIVADAVASWLGTRATNARLGPSGAIVSGRGAGPVST